MEFIKPGLQISFENLESVPVNELLIKSAPDSLELNYFLNTSECQVFSGSKNSFLIYIKIEHAYFNGIEEFPFKNMPSQVQAICCNTQFMLLDLMSTQLTGIYRKLYLESKSMELILRAYGLHVEEKGSCANCRFLQFDYNKEKIQKARQILLYQLNNPPTIPELAKTLGINQCYLKKGFKEMYNTTVYDFVQEQRMELAKGMIRNSQYNLNEISESLGFSSTSSFSKAFKKMHGVNPSELRINRN
jgi:AraC-like DNA-binding protein